MKHLNKEIHLWCLLFFLATGFTKSFSQQHVVSDSNKVFALKDLEEIVFFNHPIVKQAGLLGEEARAKVMQAWGS